MSLLAAISKKSYDKIELMFSFGIRMMGPGFIIVFYGLIFYFSFYYFKVMAGVMNMVYPFWFSFGYHLLVWFALFSVIYNHVMACLVHPGNWSNLKSDIKLQKDKGIWNRYNSHKALMRRHFKNTEPSLEIKQLFRYRMQDVSCLETECSYQCNKCKTIKLVRAHHCSVCNDCIFLMDHHCPWINNCLGLNNLRYFLLFLFYVLVGWALAIIPTYTTIHVPPFGAEYETLLTFTMTMSLLLGGAMIAFNGWNWYLWLLGDSTIEFWQLKAQKLDVDLYDPTNPEYQRFQNMRDNMYKTFGTRNFFLMFMPSMRDLPFFGHEWTFEVLEIDAEQAALNKLEQNKKVLESLQVEDDLDGI